MPLPRPIDERYGIFLLNYDDALADATACGEVLRRVRLRRTSELR